MATKKSKKDAETFLIVKFVNKKTGEQKRAKMTEKEVTDTFSELISRRVWYKDTSINRRQAFEIKRRFVEKSLSIGRQFEIMLECGCEVEFISYE